MPSVGFEVQLPTSTRTMVFFEALAVTDKSAKAHEAANEAVSTSSLENVANVGGVRLRPRVPARNANDARLRSGQISIAAVPPQHPGGLSMSTAVNSTGPGFDELSPFALPSLPEPVTDVDLDALFESGFTDPPDHAGGMGDEPQHSIWTLGMGPDAIMQNTNSTQKPTNTNDWATTSHISFGNLDGTGHESASGTTQSTNALFPSTNERCQTQASSCGSNEQRLSKAHELPAEYQQSALHIAAERGHDGLVKFLLTTAIDVDECDSDGNTALHCAAYNCHPIVTSNLLQQGANPNAKNNNGWTPVHFAVLTGSANILNLLIVSGGDLTIKAHGRQYCRSGKYFDPV